MASKQQQIVDEILAGIQKGTMQVTQVEARWDKGGITQRYILEVLDTQRSLQLSQWATTLTGTTSVMAPSFSLHPPIPSSPPIEDLGTIATPIIGYRDFYLGNGPYPKPGLVSRNKSPWPMREPMRAFCRAGALSEHDAPKLDCECGIYAFSNPEQNGLLDLGATIWGEIAMWGEVVIAEKGYRSEYAYPKTLFIKDRNTKSVRWLRDYLADGYGVPVLLVGERTDKTAAEIIGEMLVEMTEETS